MRRMKGERKANAEAWMLGLGDLYRYSADPVGLRYFSGSEREEFAHRARQTPSFPILGHAPIFWMFQKTSDVSANSWTITAGAGTPLALQDEMGGIAKGITSGADDDTQQYFSLAECVQIATDGVITFKTRIRIDEPVQCEMFVGFCEKGVNLITGRQNAVGFYLSDGSALIRVETNIGGSSEQEASEVTMVAGTWYDLAMGIHSDGTSATKRVNFFIDDIFIAEHRTNIPTAAMAFAFGIKNGEAAVNGISIGTTFLLKD